MQDLRVKSNCCMQTGHLHTQTRWASTSSLRRQFRFSTSAFGNQHAEHGAEASVKDTQTLSAIAPAAGLLIASLVFPETVSALQIEPENALSLPTWAIHVSSVAEWVIAMGLMWRYAEVSGNERFKGMTWGMLPALGSAMTACTWHFFYNSPDLEFLVALQAFLTVVGNFTCLIAAYRIWDGAKAEAS